MGRRIVIGDVHGANRALEQVLERCNFDFKNDTLISLGDIADGWSETSECVDTLLKCDNLIAIRGNHDVWVHDWIKLGISPMLWTEQGGKATLDSYVKTGRFVDKDHQDFWMKTQVDWHITEDNKIFIHAGWDYRANVFPASAQYPVNAGSIARECHWDRSLLGGAASASFGGRYNENVFNATKPFKEVYIGHTATKDHNHIQLCNLWNMDSGCGWHGRLTAMDVDTKEFWVSDFSKDLYPEEKGR